MRIGVLIVRILLGALFVFSSVVYLFQLFPVPELTGKMKTFQDGVEASGYLMPLIKITELVCGIALLTGFFVPLAVVVLLPIAVNILFVHIFLAPEGLPVALFVLLGTLFLAYYHRSKYAPLVAAK